jgi:hypothetical protein
MENKNTDARNVRGKAEKIQRQMCTQKNVGKKYCDLMSERSSLRGLERTFGVSRTSVIGWIKKSKKTPKAE